MNKHYIKHQPIFELWVETNQKISASHDLISPLIPEFVKANPGVNVHGCSECVIDMLRWYKKESKELPVFELKEGGEITSIALVEESPYGKENNFVKVKTFNERLDEVAEKKIKTKK